MLQSRALPPLRLADQDKARSHHRQSMSDRADCPAGSRGAECREEPCGRATGSKQSNGSRGVNLRVNSPVTVIRNLGVNALVTVIRANLGVYGRVTVIPRRVT